MAEEAKKSERDVMPKVMESMKEMHKSLHDTISKLNAPKKIKMTMPDGRKASAEVG